MNISQAGGSSSTTTSAELPPVPSIVPGGGTIERHTLQAEEEIRFEIKFQKQACCAVTLQRGSCEMFGVELALQKRYDLSSSGDGGGLKLALFTWHGCVIDLYVSDESYIESNYTTDETNCNIAYVNTHAQLEAMRDDAAAALVKAATTATSQTQQSGGGDPNSNDELPCGPRVLIVGPAESGKTSLAKVLTAYATKLGRTPILVDLDPIDNMISVPGTLAACTMNREIVTVTSFASMNTPQPVPGSGNNGTSASPLTLWHGSASKISVDLFREQVTALGRKIEKRLEQKQSSSASAPSASAASSPDENANNSNNPNSAINWERSSGIIVNTNGWIRDEGYQLLLHTIQALQINVVLVMGHDRLYSMIKKEVGGSSSSTNNNSIKVVKVPRSGGVVSRDADFIRSCKSRTIKRYYYGGMVDPPTTSTSGGGGSGSSTTAPLSSSTGGGASGSGSNATTSTNKVPQLTPFLVQIPFDKVTIYRFSSISLSASLLPVAAAQTTDPVQLTEEPITEKLQHALLAVCHPQAASTYETSGRPRDLYEHGVAGFVVVERVMTDTEILHLLSPCAGSLPSHTLLVGDITWME